MKQLVIALSLMLLCSGLWAQFSEDFIIDGRLMIPPDDLEEAVRMTREAIEKGTPPKEVARWVTNLVDSRVTNMNTPERLLDTRNLNPFDPNKGQREFDAWRDSGEFDNEKVARWAWEHEMGNCEENANLAYYILKQAGAPGNLRLFRTDAHTFPVWGLQDGADPKDPMTWGDDFIVVDPWYGAIISDPEKIAEDRWFGNGGTLEIKETTRAYDDEAEVWSVDGGASRSSGSDEDCFVATAVWGSPYAADVLVLQHYREQYLRPSDQGARFVAWYGKWGPVFADWLEDHPQWKAPARSLIVHPAANHARRKLTRP